MATSSSSSLPLYSTHSLTTSTSSESDLKHLQEKLDRLFGVKYVKELELEEIERRNAILTAPQRHAPTPALDISKLGVSTENRALHLPILSFSAEEILDYLILNLIKYKIITTTPFFSGGFARHCQVETPFNDLDIIFFIEAGNFDLIFHFFRNFIEIKLKALGAKLNFSSSKIFEFIESVYLYKKKIIRHEEDLASLIGFGSIEFKFVLKRHYRYYVANYERFLVPIKHNSLFFAHPESDYSPVKSSQALEDLIFGEFHVDHPETVIDPLFRITHASTNGFGIDFTSELLPDALKKFTISYPCTETASQDLMQKLRGHLDNHYPNQPEGQMVDFVNLLSLLQGLNKTSLYNHYITILAKALSCEREHGQLKLRKGKKLEDYVELISPLSKMEEKCAKIPPTLFPQVEAFKLLSTLIGQHPEISSHFVAFMQGLFFSEWCKKSPNIVMDSTKNHWQLGLQTSQDQCYYLTMPKGTLEELAINTLCSLKELNQFEVVLEQILREFNIPTFSFKELHKQAFISELLHAFESPKVRSLISLKILTGANSRVLKEFIPKEMPGYIDSQTLHLWDLQTGLQEYSRGMEEQTSLHLLIALLRHRIRHTGWQFSSEYFRQINRRLELLQNLPEKIEISENPALKALLSSCFLALLAKIQPGIKQDFFLAIYTFQSLAKGLKIFGESDHSKATAFIALLHENFQHKETVLIRGMAEALLPTCAETSQHEFCLYADILCSEESFQKEQPEAVKVFGSLMTQNFEERSTLMRLFCQILPNWRMVEESLSLFQEKMERKDFIQALYFNMKTQINSGQPEAIERALITWLSNQPSKLNAIAHLLIGIKLLEIFRISKLEKEKKEHAETLMQIANHLSSALKESPLLIKNFTIKFPSKAKTELHEMLNLLFQEKNTHILARGLQKAFKEAFLEKAVIIPETSITPEPPKSLEKRNIVPLTLPNPTGSIASKSSSPTASAVLPDNNLKKREFRGKTPRKWQALSQRTLEREWKETQAKNFELNHLVQIAKVHRFFRSIVMGISRGMAAATAKTFFEVIKKTNLVSTSPLTTHLENKLQFLAFSVIAGMFLMTNQHRLQYSAGVTAITVTQIVLSFLASINLSISEEYSDFVAVVLGSAPAFMLGWDEIVMLSATVSALAVNLFRML